jgi:hypothetical protein
MGRLPIAKVLYVRGEVTLFGADGTQRIAHADSPVFEGDRIETGYRTFLQLFFVDRAKLSFAGSTDVTVTSYPVEGAGANEAELYLGNGAVSFVAGRALGEAPHRYHLKTALATIHLRGASAELVASDGRLPGIDPSLQVRKTGGVALGVEGSGGLVHPDILLAGSGFVFDEAGLARFRQFPASIIDSYVSEMEAQIDSSRRQVQHFGGVVHQASKRDVVPQARAPSLSPGALEWISTPRSAEADVDSLAEDALQKLNQGPSARTQGSEPSPQVDIGSLLAPRKGPSKPGKRPVLQAVTPPEPLPTSEYQPSEQVETVETQAQSTKTGSKEPVRVFSDKGVGRRELLLRSIRERVKESQNRLKSLREEQASRARKQRLADERRARYEAVGGRED